MERVAVSTNKGRDFAELIDLQVLSRNALGRLGLDDLKLDVVGLGHSADSC